MNLYLIRHAEAVPLGVDGITRDADRPLTEVGRQQCRAVAGALRQMNVRLEKLVCSPLVRARQTADELVANWNGRLVELRVSEELSPGAKKRKLLRDVLSLGGESVGLVGHNPDLSELLGWLIGEKAAGLDMEKAGVACVGFRGPPAKAGGTLAWLVNPTWCELAAAARAG